MLAEQKEGGACRALETWDDVIRRRAMKLKHFIIPRMEAMERAMRPSQKRMQKMEFKPIPKDKVHIRY
jgi:hypothetical protein